MGSVLEIIPFESDCLGSVIIPGSKSISNRALLLAALSKCKTSLSGVLKSQDVELHGQKSEDSQLHGEKNSK